jgi:hypothetical protein
LNEIRTLPLGATNLEILVSKKYKGKVAAVITKPPIKSVRIEVFGLTTSMLTG